MTKSDGIADVSEKDITTRTAKATAAIKLGKAAFEELNAGRCPKGDVLTTAKIAAVNAAKSTPAIIPLCHTLLIENVRVDFELNEQTTSVIVAVSVKSTGKTGVEMEALTAAAAAALTIYDMLKYTGRDMTIENIILLENQRLRQSPYPKSRVLPKPTSPKPC